MKWVLLEKEYIVIVTSKEYESILEKVPDINWVDAQSRKTYRKNGNGTNFVLAIPWQEEMDYEHMKKIALYSIKTIQKYKKGQINLGINREGKNIIGCIILPDEKSMEDISILDILKIAMLDPKRQYEYIYDTVCQQLDKKFQKNNYCEFKDNSCIANRNGYTKDCKMGCCYSFECVGMLNIINRRRCIHLQNKHCDTACIACKLYTCKYLREKGIYFDCNKILIIDCFFNKKQKEIIQKNFFKTREQILNKLLEKSKMPYWLYYLKDECKVK